MSPPRKCHNNGPQSSLATKRRTDEEQIKIKQTPHMKTPTHEQRRTATEEPHRNVQNENYLRSRWLVVRGG